MRGGVACERVRAQEAESGEKEKEGAEEEKTYGYFEARRTEIVRADGDKRAPSADVMVEAVLQVEERVVCAIVEGAVAQHRGHDVWADLRRLRLNSHDERGARLRREQRELRRALLLKEDIECTCQTLEAENVIPVGWDLDLVDNLLSRFSGTGACLGRLHLLCHHFVELNAKLVAKILEFILGEFTSKSRKERVASNCAKKTAWM